MAKLGLNDLLAVCALAAAGSHALAQSGYEGFDYPSGTLLAGRPGGTGFSGPWLEPGGGSVRAGPGLSYSLGGTLLTSPGAAYADATRSNATLSRQFVPGAPASGELWVSFLVNIPLTNTSYALVAIPGVQPGGSSYAFSLARVTANASFLQASIAPYPGGGSGASVAPAQIAPGQTTLIVGRIQINSSPSAEVASLWVNPNLGVGLGTPDATLTSVNMVPSAVGTLRVELGSFNAGAIDEIRFGRTSAEVLPTIPTPGTAAAVVVGAMLPLVRRRRPL